jgi:predicted GNAT family acetyltransferase
MSGAEAIHNQAGQRFEAVVDGRLAYLEYRREPGLLDLVHTEVPVEMKGRGVGGTLAEAALRYARENGLRVVPHCPFAAAYIRRHPEHRDLVGSAGGSPGA